MYTEYFYKCPACDYSRFYPCENDTDVKICPKCYADMVKTDILRADEEVRKREKEE